MHLSVNCAACRTKLSVKAELAGKQVRCPRCGQPVRVTVSPVVVGNGKPTSAPLMAQLVEDDEPVVAHVSPVLVEAVPTARALPAKPLRAASPQTAMNNFEVLPEDSAGPTSGSFDGPSSKPRFKKKKKKKGKKHEETSIPAWMWIVGGLGALVTISGVIIGIWMLFKMNNGGEKPINWANLGIQFGIGVPVSLVILVASMYISSALGGGIDFGEAKTALIGGLFLVVIVNFVELIPGMGFYLSFPVWLIGFMMVFGLDLWEARFLLFINWVFNYIIGMFLIAAMLDGKIAPKGGIDVQPEFPDVLPNPNGIEMPPGVEDEDRRRPNNKKPPRKQPNKRDPEILDPDDWGYRDDLHRRMSTWVRTQYA